VAVVSLSSSTNSPSVLRRLPGSCNDINDYKNTNGCHSPSYNHLNSSPRFTFQVIYKCEILTRNLFLSINQVLNIHYKGFMHA
jgi:hypothetical protein